MKKVFCFEIEMVSGDKTAQYFKIVDRETFDWVLKPALQDAEEYFSTIIPANILTKMEEVNKCLGDLELETSFVATPENFNVSKAMYAPPLLEEYEGYVYPLVEVSRENLDELLKGLGYSIGGIQFYKTHMKGRKNG